MGLFNDSLFGSLSQRSRAKKMALLREHFALEPGVRALDVGGQLDEFGGQILEAHPDRRNLMVVNLDPQHLAAINRRHPEVTTCVADARRLPFADQSFDLAYSNAVIEHVGTLADQTAMAREMMRVARRYFVTTPNRWYPFEFHTRLPLVGWLPSEAMLRIARLWSYNHVHGCYQRGIEQDVRLLTARELAAIFPGSRLVRCRVTFWPETLVVLGP